MTSSIYLKKSLNVNTKTLDKSKPVPLIETRKMDISNWVLSTFSVGMTITDRSIKSAKTKDLFSEISEQTSDFDKNLAAHKAGFSAYPVRETQSLQEKILRIDQLIEKIDELVTSHSKEKAKCFILSKTRLDLKLRCENAARLLKSCSEKLFNKAYASLPDDSFWKVFIDPKDHVLGIHAFESTEPGYCAASRNGFEWIKQTLGHKVNSNYLIKLHAKFTQGVARKDFIYAQEEISEDFQPGSCYLIVEEEMDQGIKELSKEGLVLDTRELTSEEAIERQQKNNFLSIIGTQYENGYVISDTYSKFLKNFGGFDGVRMTKETAAKWVDQLCNEYYSSIELASNRDQKLEVICKLCVKLALFHLFEDGNGRTVKFGLLSKLLIENGFTPTILKNPPLAFGHRIALTQLLEDVIEGMENFNKVCRGEAAIVPLQSTQASRKKAIQSVLKQKRPTELSIWPKTIRFQRYVDITLDAIPPVGYKFTEYGLELVSSPEKSPPDIAFWNLYFAPPSPIEVQYDPDSGKELNEEG